jgi:acetyltransferase-like isoleucine patch superfamily enzyme
MSEIGCIVLSSNAPEGPMLAQIAGLAPADWAIETARAAGYQPRTPQNGLTRDELGERRHLVVLDSQWPLVSPASIESLARTHVSEECEATFLSSREGGLSGASRICAGCFDTAWLIRVLEGERADLVDLARKSVEQPTRLAAVRLSSSEECLRLESMADVAEAEKVLRKRINQQLMESGVRLVDPSTSYIDAGVKIEPPATIHPNTHLRGDTRLGRGVEVGPNAVIEHCEIGAGSTVSGSTIESSTLEDGVRVGSYNHIRDGAYLCRGVQIGNYAEIKNSRLGRATRMNHFGYLGDAEVGEDVNIGAGAVTCNYDGVNKHRTIIGDHAFIGSDTMLIAPVTVGAGARTAAGSVVNRDVPAGVVAIGAPARFQEARSKERTES